MSQTLDNPVLNDNRAYDYQGQDFYLRAEFPVIADWLRAGERVIDLGCGNGSLMKYLLDRKPVGIEGVEIAGSGVEHCLRHGLKVRTGAIDRTDTYVAYADKQFDVAICNVTLQMLMYPEVLLREMARISRRLIVSFPNFAYLGNRLDLLWRGRMPRPMLHGYTWYSTGHIHQLSLRDFEDFCRQAGWQVIKRRHLGCFRFLANIVWPNLFSKATIYLVRPAGTDRKI